MFLKHRINDIVCYNSQGVFSVGIIVRITIVGREQDVLFSLDNNADIREDQIVQGLGNALIIKELHEELEGEDE